MLAMLGLQVEPVTPCLHRGTNIKTLDIVLSNASKWKLKGNIKMLDVVLSNTR